MTESKVVRWYWAWRDVVDGDRQLREEREDGSTRVLLEMYWAYVDSDNPSVETERLIAQTPHLLQVTQELMALVAVMSVVAKDILSDEIVAGLQQQAERAAEIVRAATHGEPATPVSEV